MDLNGSQKVMLYKFCAYGFLKNLRFFGPFVLLFFTTGKGLSYTQFGTLVAIREICIYLLEIPTGIVADVTGRRRAMVAAFASYIVAFLIFWLGGSFWLFALGMVLFGAGEAFRSGTHKSMIMQHLDREGMHDLRVHYYGTTRSASRLGSALAVLVAGGLVLVQDGYQIVFPATIVPYVFGLGLMLTYPHELDGEVSSGLSIRQVWRHTAATFKGIWRTSQVTRVLLNASAFYAFFNAAKDYLQAVLKSAAAVLPILAFMESGTRRTAVLVAVVYFVIHINEFYSSRLAGRLAERVGDLGRALNALFWTFAAAFVLAGVFLLIGFGAASPALKWAAMGLGVLMLFFFYTLINLRTPIVTGFLSDRTDAQQRATVLSVHSQLRAVMAAAIAPAFGAIADRWGTEYVFLVGGGALVLIGLILQLRPEAPQTETAAAGPGSASSC